MIRIGGQLKNAIFESVSCWTPNQTSKSNRRDEPYHTQIQKVAPQRIAAVQRCAPSDPNQIFSADQHSAAIRVMNRSWLLTELLKFAEAAIMRVATEERAARELSEEKIHRGSQSTAKVVEKDNNTASELLCAHSGVAENIAHPRAIHRSKWFLCKFIS